MVVIDAFDGLGWLGQVFFGYCIVEGAGVVYLRLRLCLLINQECSSIFTLSNKFVIFITLAHLVAAVIHGVLAALHALSQLLRFRILRILSNHVIFLNLE